MIGEQLRAVIAQCIHDKYGADVSVELSRAEPGRGDFTTNVAMKAAGGAKASPHDIAAAITAALSEERSVASAEVAGPGFVNIRLHDEALVSALGEPAPQSYQGKIIVVEYSDPNPFKVLHAGHLYTSVVGDAIANLVEAAGGQVHRVNYGGDVGLHVGKTMWAMVQELGGEYPEKLSGIAEPERANWMAQCYVAGTTAYEEDETAKTAIIAYNKQVYRLHADDDHDSPFAQLYWTTRQWSYDYFDGFYSLIGTHFEKYYPESTVAARGLMEVRAQVGEVFAESEGAVVFAGEAFGLHTRVFITREGLPTYEAKEIGLVYQKFDDYHFYRSIIITANEQEQYMAVVMKALEQFAPELAQASLHLTHGVVKLAGGVKMSSRAGNFLRAVDVLDTAQAANKAKNDSGDKQVSLGAVKYAFLKQRMGGDIVYDPDESVSLQGNSGPYLQYAHARACSILAKAGKGGKISDEPHFDESERALASKLTEYQTVLSEATKELKPHLVCTYLYELAQTFNRFYESSKIIGDERENLRLWLVEQYRDTLSGGLKILNITAPERL
jgi:arginyl-tRNA synthetase